jgi:hypothetical protein
MISDVTAMTQEWGNIEQAAQGRDSGADRDSGIPGSRVT